MIKTQLKCEDLNNQNEETVKTSHKKKLLINKQTIIQRSNINIEKIVYRHLLIQFSTQVTFNPKT